jgi:hypothetical protein
MEGCARRGRRCGPRGRRGWLQDIFGILGVCFGGKRRGEAGQVSFLLTLFFATVQSTGARV